MVERDVLPRDPVNRRGVPQGSHPHALLGRGVAILAELFPGFFDQLVADGAVKWDDGDLSRFWSTFGGHLMVRSATVPNPASLVDYHVSRPLLEFSVRREVLAIPNVEFLEDHDVVGLAVDLIGTALPGPGWCGTVMMVKRCWGRTSLLMPLVAARGRRCSSRIRIRQTAVGRTRGAHRVCHYARACSGWHAARTGADGQSCSEPPDDICDVRR